MRDGADPKPVGCCMQVFYFTKWGAIVAAVIGLHPVAIIAVEPIVGADPDHAIFILNNGIYFFIGKSVFLGQHAEIQLLLHLPIGKAVEEQ